MSRMTTKRGKVESKRGLRVRGPRAATAVVAGVSLAFVSASGCGDTHDALDTSTPAEIAGLGEALGEGAQSLSTKIVCVDLKRAAPLKAHDTQISKEKTGTNFGGSSFALAGASSAGPADPFYALFRFPTNTIPPDATVLSANLSLSQTNNGAATANARLVLAPWDEATVTWASLGGAFSNSIFKSFSTAPATIVVNLVPQVQAWVNGSVPNHGFLIEVPGVFQSKFKTQEYAVAFQRPHLNICYQVTCAPGFADCNGDGSDGCETSLATLSDCGGCGVVCPSGVCLEGLCQASSCTDTVKNGGETDVDCGGSCGPCNPGAGCGSSADCTTLVCVAGSCQPASCADQVKNGDEAGVDCGGACTIPETCNGVDDDCNGTIDEGLGAVSCGVGACQATVPACVGGVVQVCVPGVPAAAESCDGALDDDCDGVVDNGCACVNGQTQGCYSGSAATLNVGTCHGGIQACTAGHWGACVGESTPVAESCDGLDNNCNGAADDGNPGGGASCNLANACHVGTTACIAGAVACTDTGATLAAGSACGQNQVCSAAGSCVACTQGQACTPAAACFSGAISCGSGAPVCQATSPVADGTVCAGGTCTSGLCSANGTVSGTKNLSTDSLTAGRSCAEAVAFSVTALTGSSATLSAAVTAGCMSPGDLVLLINEQGIAGATVNVGNYEILTVDTVSGTLVTFKSAKTAFYGSAAGSDANIGTGAAQQKVVLQRLPVFGNLSVPAGAVLTINPWDGLKGGVLAFRAANVTIAGSVTAAGKGYRSGGYNIDDGSCSDNLTTENGESISGPPTQTTSANGGGSGGLAGGSGISYNGNTPLSASAGHATAGQVGQNPNGRTLGPPGAVYGSGTGTNLTMGSGCGGNLTCQGGSFAPFIGARASASGGILAIFANSLTVSAGGAINASGVNGSRTAASGGYVLVRANTLSLGSNLVQAIGATGISSGNTGSFNNIAGEGYITLDYKTSLSGTTLPAALATQKPGLVLP